MLHLLAPENADVSWAGQNLLFILANTAGAPSQLEIR